MILRVGQTFALLYICMKGVDILKLHECIVSEMSSVDLNPDASKAAVEDTINKVKSREDVEKEIAVKLPMDGNPKTIKPKKPEEAKATLDEGLF